MVNQLKYRLAAFSVHLSASVFVFLIFLYFVFYWWYPDPYLTIDGGWFIVGMIVLVDVILGPSLTFIVFKPGKKGLALDLGIIAGLQVCALVYGVTVIYTERPQFLTFSVDRFVVVSPHDVEQNNFKYPELLNNKRRGPLPVFAAMPVDPAEKSKLINETMEGKPDLEFRSEYYIPLDQHLDDVLLMSKSIGDYKQVSIEYQQKIDDFIKNQCGSEDKCAYFPVVGKEKSMMMVLQQDGGRILGAIDIDPWTSFSKYQQGKNSGNIQKNTPRPEIANRNTENRRTRIDTAGS